MPRMKWLMRIVILCMVLAGLASMASFALYRMPSVAQDTAVVIEPGTGTRRMLVQLHEAGIIPAPWTILLPIVASGDHRAYKAGEYAFEEGASPAQLLGSIARGEVIIHAVTIPEGFTVAQARRTLMGEAKLVGELPARIPEGSIAPETVHFHRGDARASVIARLQEQQARTLATAWEKRVDGLPFTTPEQALTLASIVEGETGVEEERRRVAAVYINRLRMGMKLQADPTVAYGINPAGMDRMLTRNDLKRDHAYNTYTREGLPPGPICNPGKASIEAVMNPLDTQELFFVATGTGGHYFARTLAEHERNIVRYKAARGPR